METDHTHIEQVKPDLKTDHTSTKESNSVVTEGAGKKKRRVYGPSSGPPSHVVQSSKVGVVCV